MAAETKSNNNATLDSYQQQIQLLTDQLNHEIQKNKELDYQNTMILETVKDLEVRIKTLNDGITIYNKKMSGLQGELRKYCAFHFNSDHEIIITGHNDK